MKRKTRPPIRCWIVDSEMAPGLISLRTDGSGIKHALRDAGYKAGDHAFIVADTPENRKKLGMEE